MYDIYLFMLHAYELASYYIYYIYISHDIVVHVPKFFKNYDV